MVMLFRTKKLKEPSLKQRLLGLESKENGFIKLNNLMAQQRSLEHLSAESVYTVVEKHGLQLRKGQDKMHLLKMYAQLLRSAFTQQQLNTVRLKELHHFKKIFGLSDRDVHQVHHSVIQTLFKQNLEQILGTPGTVSQLEARFLSSLQNTLMLPEPLAAKICREKPHVLLRKVLQGKRSSAAPSATEVAEIQKLCRTLGVDFPKPPTMDHLHKFRLYWCIENGRVPRLSLPPTPQKKEACYLILPTQWFERRQRIRYTHYGEISVSIKSATGLPWKTPPPPAKELAREVWTLRDRGDLYLSSTRLFFAGEAMTQQLPLEKISNFLVYENGVDIQRANGETIFFAVQAPADLFAMLLCKVLLER